MVLFLNIDRLDEKNYILYENEFAENLACHGSGIHTNS